MHKYWWWDLKLYLWLSGCAWTKTKKNFFVIISISLIFCTDFELFIWKKYIRYRQIITFFIQPKISTIPHTHTHDSFPYFQNTCPLKRFEIWIGLRVDCCLPSMNAQSTLDPRSDCVDVINLAVCSLFDIEVTIDQSQVECNFFFWRQLKMKAFIRNYII